MMKRVLLAILAAVLTVGTATSAGAWCSGTYWACVTVITECEYSQRCVEFNCENDSPTGNRWDFRIRLCA